MNETASDCESQCSDTESTQDRIDEMEGIINSKVSYNFIFKLCEFILLKIKLCIEF